MKRNSLLLCVCVFALVSCKKESSTLTAPATVGAAPKVSISKALTEAGSGSQYVYQDASGNFYTLYGRGFGYGSFFPYPTTVNSSNNGTAWNPGACGCVDYMGTNLNEYHEIGGYFVVTFLQQSNYGSAGLANYYQAFDDFISGKKKDDGSGAYVQPTLPSVGNYISSGSLEVFTGHYLIDANSPTHVRIAPITESPNQPLVD